MTNFWVEKNEFWRNKTLDNQVYVKQKEEAARDILFLLKKYSLNKVYDLGGYNGALGKYLPLVDYICLDIKDGFDISEDWAAQQFTPEKDSLVVTSLTLITLSPDQMVRAVSNIKTYVNSLFYAYEETWDGKLGELFNRVNDEYGGKWRHNIYMHFLPFSSIRKSSSFNYQWERTLVNLASYENICLPPDYQR